jgi:isoleucyl-tRNA synthetase
VVIEKGEAFEIIVEKADGDKCERCWIYSSDIKNTLCERCSKVVAEN